VRGHGTFGGDRPPVDGVVGRVSGKLRLAVVERPDPATLEGFVASSTREGAMGLYRRMACRRPPA
jgi:hypothetical protein